MGSILVRQQPCPVACIRKELTLDGESAAGNFPIERPPAAVANLAREAEQSAWERFNREQLQAATYYFPQDLPPAEATPTGKQATSQQSDLKFLDGVSAYFSRLLTELHSYERTLVDSVDGTTLALSPENRVRCAFRHSDHKIVTEVLSRICMEDAPVRMLEVACGGTHPTSSNYGSPVMARALQSLFPDKLKVVATDFSRGQVAFLVSKAGVVYSELLESSAPFPRSEIFTVNGKIKLAPLSLNALTGNHRCALQKLFNKHENGEISSAFVRPVLDPEFERHISGISIFSGVNFFALPETLPHSMEPFDLLVGRHLFDGLKDTGEAQVILSRAAPILKVGAWAQLVIDHPRRTVVAELPEENSPTRVHCKQLWNRGMRIVRDIMQKELEAPSPLAKATAKEFLSQGDSSGPI